ncbi:MAG: hypothetical protein SFH39_00360 [Candidatus Magnetobacterium sp. LHC-1]
MKSLVVKVGQCFNIARIITELLDQAARPTIVKDDNGNTTGMIDHRLPAKLTWDLNTLVDRLMKKWDRREKLRLKLCETLCEKNDDGSVKWITDPNNPKEKKYDLSEANLESINSNIKDIDDQEIEMKFTLLPVSVLDVLSNAGVRTSRFQDYVLRLLIEKEDEPVDDESELGTDTDVVGNVVDFPESEKVENDV